MLGTYHSKQKDEYSIDAKWEHWIRGSLEGDTKMNRVRRQTSSYIERAEAKNSSNSSLLLFFRARIIRRTPLGIDEVLG